MLSKEGEGPVGEPIRKAGLPALLAEWDPLDEEFPEIEDVPPACGGRLQPGAWLALTRCVAADL